MDMMKKAGECGRNACLNLDTEEQDEENGGRGRFESRTRPEVGFAHPGLRFTRRSHCE